MQDSFESYTRQLQSTLLSRRELHSAAAQSFRDSMDQLEQGVSQPHRFLVDARDFVDTCTSASPSPGSDCVLVCRFELCRRRRRRRTSARVSRTWVWCRLRRQGSTASTMHTRVVCGCVVVSPSLSVSFSISLSLSVSMYLSLVSFCLCLCLRLRLTFSFLSLWGRVVSGRVLAVLCALSSPHSRCRWRCPSGHVAAARPRECRRRLPTHAAAV
jgi:hypothetical protein